MKRRDALRELMRPPLPDAADAPAAETPPPARRSEPVRAGALRSMGLSLKQMSAEADDARALRAQIEAGQHVVDLDPGLVDPSFVADRIPAAHDPEADAFVQSIAEAGQQVPILVRPHPDAPGRYQAAYGHRRLRAAAALGRPVRAIVRPLSDAELVVAQGKENGDRRDLSFIERATFAAHLEERGFERPTIMAALGVDKADLSRLIALAGAVPPEVVRAIGPAPKAGRPRWTQLAEGLAGRADALDAVGAVLASDPFAAAGSDGRFALVLAALQAPRARAESELWRDRQGRGLVRVDHAPGSTRLTVDERWAQGFGAFLVERLQALHDEFTRGGGITERPSAGRRAGARADRPDADGRAAHRDADAGE